MLKPYNLLYITVLWLLVIIGCNGCDDGPTQHGGEQWPIMYQTDFGRMPRWSPDGSRLLFGGDTPGHPGIFIWDTEGEPVQIAADVPAHNWDYRWSPDGSEVVFTCPGGESDSLTGVWVYNTADSTSRRMFPSGCDVCWAADGAKLFLRLDNPSTGSPGVYRLILTAEKDSVTGCELAVADGNKPLAAPAGDLLGYIDNPINGALHIINSTGEEALNVAPGVIEYKWSSSGKTLVCVLNDYTGGELTGELWLARPDSTRRLTRISQFTAYAAPDSSSSQIAYSRWSAGRWDGLWLFRAPSTNFQILSYGLNADFNPASDKIAVNAPGGGIKVLVRSG